MPTFKEGTLIILKEKEGFHSVVTVNEAESPPQVTVRNLKTGEEFVIPQHAIEDIA